MDQLDQQLEAVLSGPNGWRDFQVAFTYGIYVSEDDEEEIEGCVLRYRDLEGDIEHVHKLEAMIFEKIQSYQQQAPALDNTNWLNRQTLRDLQSRLLHLGFVIEAAKLSPWIRHYDLLPED